MEHALTTLDWKLLLAVLGIPLGAFVVQIFFGRRLPRGGDWLPTAGMFVVMCITVRMLFVALGAAGHGPRLRLVEAEPDALATGGGQ